MGESKLEAGEMRAVVTGATGFVGRHLVEALLERGWRVTAAVRRPERLGGLADFVETVKWDAKETISQELRHALHSSNVIFHLAGVVKSLKASDFYRVNTIGTNRLYDTCRGARCRFIFVSSHAAAGPSTRPAPLTENSTPRPRCHYGLSKLTAEIHITSSPHTPYIILRPSLVFGPGDPETTQLLRAVKRGLVLSVPGHIRRVSMVYVSDLVEALLFVATNDKALCRTFFVTHPESNSITELMRTMAQVGGWRVRRVNIPCSFMVTASFIAHIWGHISGKVPSLNLHKLPHILSRWWLCSPAHLMSLGWRPRFNTIAAVTDWLK